MATGSLRTNNNSVRLTSFLNNWSENGLCFYKQTGDMVTLHMSIRNGTTTDNTKILSLPSLAPSTSVLIPIITASGVTPNGYLTVNPSGDITIKNVTTANIYCDASWVLA